MSIIKATLAIYPLSSNIVIQTKSESITGSKTSIPPTPPTIPSTISDWNQGDEFDNNSLNHGIKESFSNPSSISDKGCPTHENVI